MPVTIYHNPRCSKSRETLKLIREKGVEPVVVEYLRDTPSAEEIAALLKKLGMAAADLVRKGEAVYKEQFKGRQLSEAEWVSAMAEYPQLIERPIVVSGKKAVLGRPPEQVLEIL